MSEVFTFVDATHLISKVGLWKERDKAIELKLESLSNKTLEKVAFDKGYCDKNANKAALAKGVHLCAIKKNNMKGKNRDLDRYYTAIRAPFEHVFSKQNKRVRYRGIARNQFSAFMQAITFNFKRLVVLNGSSPPLTT